MRRSIDLDVEILGRLRTERLPDGRRSLLEPLPFAISGVRFTVPAGFATDYSSFPWWSRWIVRWSKVDVAGVIHDWLYQTGQLTRSTADYIWRVVAQTGEARANPAQAWVSWAGLRLGGWVRWRYYRRSSSLQTKRGSRPT